MEICDIQRKHNIEKRQYGSKITKSDLLEGELGQLKNSAELSRTKKKRTIKNNKAFKNIKKEDEIM